MGLCAPTRCGCAIDSRSVHVAGNGTGDDPYALETYQRYATLTPDTRPTGVDRYDGMQLHVEAATVATEALVPIVGRATTPDIAAFTLGSTDDFVITAKLRKNSPWTGTDQVIAAHGNASPQLSWAFYLHSGGDIAFSWGSAGTAYTSTLGLVNAAATWSLGTDFYVGAIFTRDPTGQATLQGIASNNGTDWFNIGLPQPTFVTTAFFNSTDPISIGGRGSSFTWSGNIYWVETRRGEIPGSGTRMFRFDAADHTSGTTWTDADGLTWTLSGAGAVTTTSAATTNATTQMWDGTAWRTTLQGLTPYVASYANLVIGTGGTATSTYTRTEHVVTAAGQIVFGGGGGPTGGLQGTVPIPPRFVVDEPYVDGTYHGEQGIRQLGLAYYYDASTGQVHTGSVDCNYTITPAMAFYTSVAGVYVSPTTPFGWTAGDEIWWKITYDAGDDASAGGARWGEAIWGESVWS